MQTTKLPSIGLDRSIAVDLAVQRAVLAAVPEVTSMIARTGPAARAWVGGRPSNP
jgi:cobalt-zinc-cadmium resistance protein CzcA